jgi:uncharacterized FlaG/YvyC family protein
MSNKITRVGPPGMPDPMNPRLQPIDLPPLINPDMVGSATAAQRALIGLTQATVPEKVRAEQLALLESAVDTVNAYIRSTQAGFSIRFELHQRSGLMYALIINTDNRQVLKQIPSETLLNIAARVRQASGIFVDMAT